MMVSYIDLLIFVETALVTEEAKSFIMKTIAFFIIFSLLSAGMFAQSEDMEVHLRNCQFYAPEQGTYVETYVMIPGEQLQYKQNAEGKYQATVSVTMLFEQDGKVKGVEKYNLNSLALDDSVFIQKGLLDLKRFLLEPGTYQFEATFKDVHQPGVTRSFTDSVTIAPLNKEGVAISGIQPLENFTKSDENSIFQKMGYKMVPKVTSFYPESINKFHFYTEIYNSKETFGKERFLVSYHIENYRTNEVIPELGGYVKMKPAKVKSLLRTINIQNLPTGNYNLVIEVINQQQEMLSQQSFFFQRSNSQVKRDYASQQEQKLDNSFVSSFSKDELAYQLESTVPIASAKESNQIYSLVKTGDKERMQQFFLAFWQQKNPTNPYKEWREYSQQVKEVNKHFQTPIRHGFETDRGRVYLEYGPPNEIVSSPREPGGDPYEIWHYNQVEREGIVKFVFHDQDLVSNNYRLIHSTADGEIENRNWKQEVYNSFPGDDDNSNNELGTPGRDHFGRQADDFFDE